MTRPYTPTPDGVTSRVIGFFARNPDEELTAADVAAKFQVHKTSVPSTLARAVRVGLLTRTPDGDGLAVYRKGDLQP